MSWTLFWQILILVVVTGAFVKSTVNDAGMASAYRAFLSSSREDLPESMKE